MLRSTSDGRLARFAILYVERTSEDAAAGAHETFLEEVVGLTDAHAQYTAGTDPALITRFLSAPTPADGKTLLAQVAIVLKLNDSVASPIPLSKPDERDIAGQTVSSGSPATN